MAIRTWEGGAPAIAQIGTLTPANVEINDVFTATLADDLGNSYQITFTAAAETVANVTAGLAAAALAAKTAGHEPWDAVTVTDGTTLATITATTAGKPFTCTTTATDGGIANTQTLTYATTTAASGPTIYDLAENIAEGSVPVNADDVTVPRWADQNILYGLAQSAVLLASFTTERSSTAVIGSDQESLHIDADTVLLEGTGAQFLRIDNPTSQIQVRQSGAAADGSYGKMLRGAGWATGVAIDITSGSVGLAAAAGETLTCSSMSISCGNGEVVIGQSVTAVGGGAITTLTINAGKVTNYSAAVTVTVRGALYQEKGALTTLTVLSGGVCYYNATAAPTSIVLMGGGKIIMGPGAGAPTNVDVYGTGWTLEDPYGRITGRIDLNNCAPSDGSWKGPSNKGWTPSAVA